MLKIYHPQNFYFFCFSAASASYQSYDGLLGTSFPEIKVVLTSLC
jgi:hypothetical protein